jgi:Domain of unknown function (DUF4416)
MEPTSRPAPVKLFSGILLSDGLESADAESELRKRFGPIDHRAGPMPFDFTEYYRKEMGKPLTRVLCSFEELVDPVSLAHAKCETRAIEDRFRREDSGTPRTVNIDPGYIEQSKVVLASTKNFYHRIYLDQGIFAEVTMHFRNNTYQFFPWTYPDYKSRDYLHFFIRMRQIYRSQLRRMCQNRTPGSD